MKINSKYFYPFVFKFLVILSLFCLFPFTNCPVYAAQVRLGWISTSATNPDLIGYVVYWGNESRKYSKRVDVGKKYNYTITELEDNQTYYFALTSYFIDAHVESEFSNEVSVNTGDNVHKLLLNADADADQTGTGNQPPVADAGADLYEFPGSFVTLNGSNSSDPDGESLAYLWIQISGPAVILDDPEASDPTFILPEEGIEGKKLTFQLTVKDASGLQSNDLCFVVAQKP